jgi:glycosyltransferase involved in cell wall biosynthesis
MKIDSSRQSNRRHSMVVHAYYPHGETRVQRQAEALVRHGYEVDILCLRGRRETATEFCNGVWVIRLPVRRRNYDWVVGQLLEYLRFFLLAMLKLIHLHGQRPYSTVQLHNLPDFLVFAAWVPKLFGARIILDLHDLMPEFYQGRYGGGDTGLLVRLLYLQEKLSCRFADHVITVSELWRQTLIGRGMPADKCSVVMNVADHTVFHQTGEPKAEPGDEGGLRLIYHGILAYRCGLDLAVQAVAKVRHQIPNIHLTIHGGGECYPNLVALAKELDLLDQHVHFSTKFVPVADLPGLIRSADVGLVPYRTDVFTDGIVPTKLMEYAALGMPAIASRTTAIETYFKGTMVELFTPGDADDLARCILKLHSDWKRLAQLAQGAEKFNQRYNWEKIGAEYVALVERLGSR